MAAEFPISYKDPAYASLDAKTEQKLGLPVGLLSSVRSNGEKSNHDQTNELGTSTVYQFIPATRKAILDKYGIDVNLSPENASEGAGLLLKEGLDRNKGNAAQAVGEYIGGLDRNNWGKTTNAYVNRVMVGQNSAKRDALSEGFSKFMADNPATPAAKPAVATPAPDALSSGFTQWLQQQAAPKGADAIPVEPGANTAPTIPAETTFGDKIVGAGEAGLNAATALTGGTVGMVGGAAKGIASSILDGSFGTPEAAKLVEQAASEGAQALTYAPRTQSGQEQSEAVGQAMQAAIPVMPLAAELGAVGRGAAPVAGLARDGVVRGAQAVQEGAQAVAARGRQLVGGEPQPVASGGFRSGGAAGVDPAVMRQATAEQLPVPITLTKGQATRDFGQMRFEQETAKDPSMGQPLRENAAEQNAQIPRNFESMIDQTGAQAVDLIGTGRAVDSALVKDAAKAKAEYRVKYNQADKGGQMMDPVDLAAVADYLNENRAGRTSAPIMKVIADELGVQKIGQGSLDDGSLVAGTATLKQSERLRQAINKFAKSDDANDLRVASDLKGIIDTQTEGLGGQLYKDARQARQRYAQLYENNAIISNLLKTRKGTADRQVALEDVFRKTILNGSRADLSNLRKTLHVSKSAEGAQAWRELQGATIRHLMDEATKNVATDIRGNPIVSAAKLNNAVRALDEGTTNTKLDFILTKNGAQTVRDLNEITKYVYTSPPGTVNTSNTASVLMAALAEAGATGAITGLPVPVLGSLKALANHMKNRKIQQRVQEALNKKGL